MATEIPNPKPEEPNSKKNPLPEATTRDTIAYILMVVGLVLLLFQTSLGGLIVGLVAGVFFSDELIQAFDYVTRAVKTQGTTRTIIGAGLLLGLFISAPGIFIGALIAVGIKRVVNFDMLKK